MQHQVGIHNHLIKKEYQHQMLVLRLKLNYLTIKNN